MKTSRKANGRRSILKHGRKIVSVLAAALLFLEPLSGASLPLDFSQPQPAEQPPAGLEAASSQEEENPAMETHAAFFSVSSLSGPASVRDGMKAIQAVLNGGAASAKSNEVQLGILLPEGFTAELEMRTAVNGWEEDKFSAWEPFSASKTIRLPGYDGTHYVNVCFRDGEGNSGCKWDSILLDRTKPAGAFTINGGAAVTKNRDVILDIQAADAGSGVSEMRWSVNGTKESDFSEWEAYSPQKQIRISGFEGKNYVNVCFKDGAGNTSCAWKFILLDRSKPSGTVIINQEGAQVTNSRDVTLSLQASDTGSGLKEFRYAVNTWKEESFSAWQPYSEEAMIRLPDYKGRNYVNVCFRDHAGNTGCAWNSIEYDPAYMPVRERLLAAGMDYFKPGLGTVESTHQYPGEGLDYMEYTQPSNLGFYAELLASIAAGDINEGPISHAEAVQRLKTLLEHLLEDQEALGHLGLLPWFKWDGSDWLRREADIFGRQVSFEDNANLTLMLAAAYGALLDESLAGNPVVHGASGLLEMIDRFIENQREGYGCLFDAERGQFRRSLAINDGADSCGETSGALAPAFSGGYVDFFGAESRSPVLFLSLIFENEIPRQAYTDLILAASTYTMESGLEKRTPAPFQGAFQMLWPALLMPEHTNEDLRKMQEDYVDILLDHSRRNDLPGFLSASYNIRPAGNILNDSREVVPFGEAEGQRTGEGWRITAANHTWSGTAFLQNNRDLEGSELVLKYRSSTTVPLSYIEVKKERNGNIEVIHVIPLDLENTGGEELSVRIDLSEVEAALSDVDELVLITQADGAAGPLDLTLTDFYSDPAGYESFYDANAGIPEIAFSGECCTSQAVSLYTAGIARMFRPEEIDIFLEEVLEEHPELISPHGLWEGINVEYGTVIREQIFPNTVTFLLGLAGTAPDHMMRYLEHKSLADDLAEVWNPAAPLDILEESETARFVYEGMPGVSYKLRHSRIASGQTLEIDYDSPAGIPNVKLELKHRNSHEAAAVYELDFTPGQGTLRVELPEGALLWNIHEFVFLFPEGSPENIVSGFRILPRAEAD